MAELRFFHGTKAQYDAVANKQSTDFYVTNEKRAEDGQTYYALWIGENLIANARTVVELHEEIARAKAAEADLVAQVKAEEAARVEAVKSLEERIANVQGDAKSYKIEAITDGLAANVKEAFKLVDEDGVQAGDTINIYKDSALQKVELDGQILVFTYMLSSGELQEVRIDVSNFLAEEEFKVGLQVVDHVVSVKIDAESEKFLSVSEAGVKLAGVQAAIDAAVAAEKAERETADKVLGEKIAAEVKAREEAVENEAELRAADVTKLDHNIRTEAERALAAEKVLDEKIANAEAVLNKAVKDEADRAKAAEKAEEERAMAAEKALDEALAAEVARAEAVEAALNEALTAEVDRAVDAEAVLRTTTVVKVQAAANSAVHVKTAQGENGKVVTVGMQWLSIPQDLASNDGVAAFLAEGGDAILSEGIAIDGTLNIEKDSTINLNHQVLMNKVDNAATDVLVVKSGATLDIVGEGSVIAVSGNDGYPVIADGAVNIYGGYFESGVDAKGLTNACVYARGNGHVVIYGGEFHSADGAFVLNIKDGDRATAKIEVMGGRFYNFNPADNASEGPHTNFVAEGYISIEVEPNVWDVVREA